MFYVVGTPQTLHFQQLQQLLAESGTHMVPSKLLLVLFLSRTQPFSSAYIPLLADTWCHMPCRACIIGSGGITRQLRLCHRDEHTQRDCHLFGGHSGRNQGGV